MMRIALLGHVDHGKSTLIGRLLYDTGSVSKEKLEEIENIAKLMGQKIEFAHIVDALKEEREEQKTIEAGRAFFKSKKREYELIDVPGHKEYLKNMVTGASEAHFGILIVDATRGMEEQSKRQAFLAKLLGLEKIIVAVNKMDLVGYRRNVYLKVKKDVIRYLKKLKIRPVAFVPISAYVGDNVVKKSRNMPWYKGKTLLQILDSLKENKAKEKTLAAVEYPWENKIFVLLIKGNLEVGRSYVSYPNKNKVKILEIWDGTRKVRKCSAPKAVAIIANKNLKRGEIITDGKLKTGKRFKARVFCISGKIKEGDELKLRIMTQETKVKINRIEVVFDVKNFVVKKRKELNFGEIGLLRLAASSYIVVDNFSRTKELSRFVLIRRNKIIGGGIFETVG